MKDDQIALGTLLSLSLFLPPPPHTHTTSATYRLLLNFALSSPELLLWQSSKKLFFKDKRNAVASEKSHYGLSFSEHEANIRRLLT